MKRKALRCSLPLVLGLVLCTGLATAGDLAPAIPEAPQPTLESPVCDAQSPALAPAAADLFTPEPEEAAICPLIGCVDDQYCRRDRDCTAAPGGVCNLFCPTRGCCAYPSS